MRHFTHLNHFGIGSKNVLELYCGHGQKADYFFPFFALFPPFFCICISFFSNMDIRDAIFALVNVIQKSSKKVDTHDAKTTEMTEKVWISRKKKVKRLKPNYFEKQ